jgi:hypothetical protein
MVCVYVYHLRHAPHLLLFCILFLRYSPTPFARLALNSRSFFLCFLSNWGHTCHHQAQFLSRFQTSGWALVAQTYNSRSEVRRASVQSQPGQIVPETLSRKNPLQKRAGRVAQVIEHLPGKCKALTSNPSTAKKKKKIINFCLSARFLLELLATSE